MGITIHFSGKFNPDASLREMIEEVREIAGVYNWPYYIFEEYFPPSVFAKETYDDKIYGISFTPQNCDQVNLCFLSNGRMSSPANLKAFGNSTEENYQKYLYMLSTKTQFTGPNIHKLIIHLLKYMSKKYFKEFEVIDEGRYWETCDEKLLDETFKKYEGLLDVVGFSLEKIPMNPNETFEEYIKRILKLS